MDIGGWLRSLGRERYEAAFRENEIDDPVLPSLTAEDLKDLGVGIVGHRRKMLDAIAVLGAYASAKAPTAEAPSILPKPAQDAAERRQVTVMFADLVGSTDSPRAWTLRTCARSSPPIEVRRRDRAALRRVRGEVHG